MAAAYQPAPTWNAATVLTDVRPAGRIGPRTLPVLAAIAATCLLLICTGGAGAVSHATLIAAAVPPAGMPSPLTGVIAAIPGYLLPAIRALVLFCGCYGLMRITARLAGSDAGGMAAAALVVGLTWLAAGPALVSGTPTFAGVFGPAQGAIALLMLALALLLDGHPVFGIVFGIALLGPVFVLQPDVALWGLALLAGASVGFVPAGMRIGLGWLAGGSCALLVAVPVAIWWSHSGGFVPAAAPVAGLLPLPRWRPGSVPLAAWVPCACMLVTGSAAFSALGPERRGPQGAFLAGTLFFLCGCVAPLFTANPWLTGLRPMAADATLQPLAVAAVAAVLAHDLNGKGGPLRLALSVIAAACLLLHPGLLPLAALAMLARAAAAHGEFLGIEYCIGRWNRVALPRAALGAVVLAALAGGILQKL